MKLVRAVHRNKETKK